ncbi:pyridoxine/pyridoxamine 5'-phosphate oxidase [Alteromonas gilva]|uniref:Pyridoxal 5'-phosphate synthase n=1 Tax=Alteromonas gilva TaxID=2987522 RepID=A0ABT5KXY6_9ALTE|nr:pyridoxal 5'-phosphate synthase [Alteromonas gilva]MDC8829635.1 pyridoxal 5'-phosphate synthase [Alteromonas gilva]
MNALITNKFQRIWQQAKESSPLKQQSAVCISTINQSGYPESRFVDLKAVSTVGFTFCTAYNSAKGRQIEMNPKVSLVAWWDHIGYQVRVVGTAARITNELADEYWNTRSFEAQMSTTTFAQSREWTADSAPLTHFEQALANAECPVQRPAFWGGYTIKPQAVEFLTFMSNRVHQREHFSWDGTSWQKRLLQP